MVTFSVQQKLSQLGFSSEILQWENLRHLAHLTALKQSPSGQFHLGHWWRGPLLYSLVYHHRPCHILEFGTGRGYGSICMAKAAWDAGIPCTLWTIDKIPPTTPQLWPIDEGNGPEIKQLSLAQIWDQYLPAQLTQRIHCLTGDSAPVMKKWRQNGKPSIDFCFIDGGHDYWTVKHDFLSALKVVNPGCTFLFDDYIERNDYGIKRLVDREIRRHIPPQAIEIIDVFSENTTQAIPHPMVLLPGEHIESEPTCQFYTRKAIRRFEWSYKVLRKLLSILNGRFSAREDPVKVALHVKHRLVKIASGDTFEI